MIFTSYYSRISFLRNFGKSLIFCPISNSFPKIENIKFCLDFKDIFKPNWKIIQDLKEQKITKEQYIFQYIEQLKNIPNEKFQKLIEFGNKFENQDIVLLCYEKPENFCHRQILSLFINKKFNQNIKEL